MVLERLKRVCRAIELKHATVVTWHVSSKLGKKMIVEGVVNKELYEVIKATLLEHDFNAIDWIVRSEGFEITVRDVA